MYSSSKHGRFGFCFIKIEVDLTPKTLLEGKRVQKREEAEMGSGDHPSLGG